MTLRLLCGDDARISEWVTRRIDHAADLGPCRAIGVVDDDDAIVAGVVYHGYDPMHGGVEMSMAADSARWATRGIIRGILHYPFVQLRCIRISTIIPSRNARARRLNEGIGFQLEGVIRRGFGSDDACVYGLLREEATRWIGE